MQFWYILAVLAGLALVALIVTAKKKVDREPNYYQFFIIGIVWVGAGTAIYTSSGNPGLLAMGVVFTALGLLNRDKWDRDKKRMAEMTPQDRRLILVLAGGLALTLLIGLITYMIMR